MTQLYTGPEATATNLAHEQTALPNSFSSLLAIRPAYRRRTSRWEGKRGRESGAHEGISQRGSRWPMFWGLLAHLNLSPCSHPPHEATMAGPGHSWEGYERGHCPHLCYRRIHKLRVCDPLVQSHTGNLRCQLSYCLKKQCPLQVKWRLEVPVRVVLEVGDP